MTNYKLLNINLATDLCFFCMDAPQLQGTLDLFFFFFKTNFNLQVVAITEEEFQIIIISSSMFYNF